MSINAGGGSDRPAPGIPAAVARFGRPVGVLVRPALPGERLLDLASTDGHLSSLDIAYDSTSGLVVVRTTRPAPPGQRVWPVHDLAGALASFAANLEMTGGYVNGAELLARYLGRAEAADADELEVDVAGAVTPGRVLRVGGHAALEVAHEGEILVVLGPSDLLGDIALAVVRPD